MSDFIDDNYHNNLVGLSKKHDLVVVHVSEPREGRFPRLGIIPVFDKEAGKNIWINSSSPSFRRKINGKFKSNRETLQLECKKNDISYLQVRCDQDYLLSMIQLFKIRNRKNA